MRPASCVCVCAVAIWDLGDSVLGPDKGGVSLCGAEATAHMHMFPLSLIYTFIVFFSAYRQNIR